MSASRPPDAPAFAQLLCDWCLEVEPGQRVLVESTTLAESLALELHRAVLDRQAWPFVRLTPPSMAADFYRRAAERQRAEPPPIELALLGAIDSLVRIDAPANASELADIDPALIAAIGLVRRPLQEATMARRWCGTLLPTPALAQQAGMAEGEYAAFVARALFLDRADPIAAWRELSAGQARLIEKLSGAREIRIEAEGTDVSLSVEGRTWINSDGRRNMPSGEVFTGPVEDTATGRLRCGFPVCRDGRELKGIALEFEQGKVVSARADAGEDYLLSMLDLDAGSRRLGELGLGLNAGIQRFTGSILYDEKIGGTVHLALGQSYPETGGVNASALHWDLIVDTRAGGRVTADGRVVMENGVWRVG